MPIKSLNKANLKGKTVLMRCDFNVPIEKKKVKDSFKIEKSLPTIQYCLSKGAKVILMSHLGRPKGKRDMAFTLRPVKNYLQDKLEEEIELLDALKIEKTKQKLAEFPKRNIFLLENVRFSPDEKENTGIFSEQLASLADLFVIDGFAVSHRASASVVGIAGFLPTYAGQLMEQEIIGLSKLIQSPKKPFVVVLGGAKMETKIPVIKNLLSKADHILLGGGIVNTYLMAKGHFVASSIFDKNLRKEAMQFCDKKKVITPVDLIVGSKDGKKHEHLSITENFGLKKDWGIFDIGPETVQLYAKYIKNAQTLVWNGAMGMFEVNPYQFGTYAIARLVASRAKGRAYGVAGGGETVEVLKKLDIFDEMDMVSTGGGAMLEFLAGKKLPGVKIVLS